MEDFAGSQGAELIKTSRNALIRTACINSPLVPPVMLLLAGMGICLASAFGLTQALCITEGCQLYQSYKFFGLSLHFCGAVAFGISLFSLFFLTEAYPIFIEMFLWAEILLLAYQVVYVPCSECILVGLIWGLLAILEIRKRVSVKIWSVVFLVALVLLGKDLLHPWSLYGPGDAPVKVYFSPSCKACRSEIEQLLAGKDAAREKVAFFPVALKTEDLDRVHSFQSVLGRTMNLDLAFHACWTGAAQEPMGWQGWLKLKLGLIKNRLVLARMGVHKIPLVLSGSLASASDEPAGECGFDNNKDCADKTANTPGAPRPSGNKVASVQNVQLQEGESPETAEITPPQAPAPAPAAPEETTEKQPQEDQAQAPNIQVFTQYEPEAEAEAKTPPQPEAEAETLPQTEDDDE